MLRYKVVLLLLAVCALAATDQSHWIVPTHVNVTLQAGYGEGSSISPKDQSQFDQFSWQSFVALNQPVQTSAPLRGTNDSPPRIWETWPSAEELYGAAPPGSCGPNGGKVLRLMSKNPHNKNIDDEFIQATGQPLVDQNINFVLYEIHISPQEAEFVRNNNLNTYDGQLAYMKAHPGNIDLPVATAPGAIGSIEIKAAWMLLDPKSPYLTDFYTRHTAVYIDGDNTVSGQPLCIQDALVGLVGLHIIHKTSDFTRWVWSTFEQVNNTANAEPGPYNFFDPDCLNCTTNQAPALLPHEKTYKWEMTPPYAKRYGCPATNVVRVSQISPYTDAVTVEWWTKYLTGTWMSHYQLIGTQWSKGAPEQAIVSIPAVLGNSTLETYIQGSSSCINCHLYARDTAGQCSDFSFAMGMVSKPQGLAAELAPKTSPKPCAGTATGTKAKAIRK